MSEKVESMIKSTFDGVTISGVIGYLTGIFTLPNLVTLFTAIWAFGRAVEIVTGRPFHEWVKKYCKFCDRNF